MPGFKGFNSAAAQSSATPHYCSECLFHAFFTFSVECGRAQCRITNGLCSPGDHLMCGVYSIYIIYCVQLPPAHKKSEHLEPPPTSNAHTREGELKCSSYKLTYRIRFMVRLVSTPPWVFRHFGRMCYDRNASTRNNQKTHTHTHNAHKHAPLSGPAEYLY